MLNEKNARLFLDRSGNCSLYRELTPIATIHGMTLEEKIISKKLDVSHLIMFGCIAYVHVPNEKRSKLNP
jgi:hypothetical protein